MDKLLHESWTAVSTFLGSMVTFVTALQANGAMTDSNPSNWTYAVGFGVSAAAAFLASKKNVNPQVEAVLTTVEKILESHAAAVSAPPIKAPPVGPRPPEDVMDEVRKVIATYKATKKTRGT